MEEQAKGPVLNPLEMAMPSAAAVEARLRAIPGYAAAFLSAFPGKPLSFDNLARAIGAFERKLVTPSRFDRFLEGERSALTVLEQQGYAEFERIGCITCHNGPYIGGRLFHRLGTGKPWPDDADPGRFAVTHQRADRRVFKVPSLRNVARTGPYFHNGRVPSLDEAVHLMAEHQLQVDLTDAQGRLLVAFLRSLTGPIPNEYVRRPQLPE